jgi:hypothetical protein
MLAQHSHSIAPLLVAAALASGIGLGSPGRSLAEHKPCMFQCGEERRERDSKCAPGDADVNALCFRSSSDTYAACRMSCIYNAPTSSQAPHPQPGPSHTRPLAEIFPPGLPVCSSFRHARPVRTVGKRLIGRKVALRGTVTLGRLCTTFTLMGCKGGGGDCCVNWCLTPWVVVDSGNPTSNGFQGITIRRAEDKYVMSGRIYECHTGPAARLEVEATGTFRRGDNPSPIGQGYYLLDHAELCRIPEVR